MTITRDLKSFNAAFFFFLFFSGNAKVTGNPPDTEPASAFGGGDGSRKVHETDLYIFLEHTQRMVLYKYRQGGSHGTQTRKRRRRRRRPHCTKYHLDSVKTAPNQNINSEDVLFHW
ncbi:hypothetical protein NQD34_011545 [Periophthalmus magnuspinnatus]|nr:hypothetical protein NQD34_011545 [Periophthalmus magnuspinnatus]